jgi:hypothetical protein
METTLRSPLLPSRRRTHSSLRRTFLALTLLAVTTLFSRAQSAPTASPSSTPSTTATSTMKTFVILFRQRPRQFTEVELAQRQKDVSAWARTQNAAGHKLDPRILGPDAVRSGETLPDGSHAGAWPLTAILFLEAEDLATAARIAEAHPANHYGTNVEVRPWAPPAPPAVPATPPAGR